MGDIHGQIYDLLKFYRKLDRESNLLFLGDYVDRGVFSVEVMLFLLALKVERPHKVFLLRGNHECRAMAEFFTFRDECVQKYDIQVYEAFVELFDLLPLACLLEQEYFCLHGGLSPEIGDI